MRERGEKPAAVQPAARQVSDDDQQVQVALRAGATLHLRPEGNKRDEGVTEVHLQYFPESLQLLFEGAFHGGIIPWMNAPHARRRRSRRISRAAFQPGAPMTPPPGWAAAPQR